MKILCRLLSVSVTLALALAARPSAAIVVTSGDLAVNSYTTNTQRLPTIAMAADQSFVVSWESNTQDGSQNAVRGRRFDSSGVPLTSELAINQVTLGQQENPSVSSRPDGTFVVSWTHETDIRARVFAGSGVPIGSETSINAYTTDIQSSPVVDFLPDGSFMTAWQSSDQDGSGYGVYARRFLSSGTPATGEFRVPSSAVGNQTDPALRARRDGTLVAAWDDSLWEGSVLSERFDPQGTLIGSDTVVNAYTTGLQRGASIDPAHDGSYVVTWDSVEPSGRVVARRFASNGTALTGDLFIGDRVEGASDRPAVASNVDGSFVVAWRDTASDSDIRIREFDGGGAALGSELVANAYTTGDQYQPQIAMEPGGFLAVSWSSGSPFADVRARTFRTDRIVAEDFATFQVPTYWTTVSPDSDLALTAEAALAGTAFGMELTVDDTDPMYLQSDLPRAEGLYRVRFYLDPNGFTVGTDGDRTKILQLFATDPVQRRLVTLVLRVQGGQHKLLAKAHQDDDSWVNTGFHTISDEPHVVELLFLREGGFLNGVLQMWIDGVQVASLDDVENEDGGRVDFVRWGVLGVQPGATGVLFFDLFESRRQTYIGL